MLPAHLMRFALPAQLLNELRAWRSSRSSISSEEREHDAFWLVNDFWHNLYLTSDGRVLVLVETLDGFAPIREATDSEAFKAIVGGAARALDATSWLCGVTGLLDLLPKAPDLATRCAYCDGKRYRRRSTAPCEVCDGLGWTVPMPNGLRGP
jgi:hypothetical protein